MTEPKPQSPVLFVDNPHAPEVFASFMCGAAFDGPNARMSFASSRVNHATTPGPVNNVVNLRVVMSIPAARQMCDFLANFLKTAELNDIRPPEGKPLQ